MHKKNVFPNMRVLLNLEQFRWCIAIFWLS